MPTYEYLCEKGHSFDAQQRMADDTLTECVVCGAPVQRVFHPPAVHFKGSGFHNTDYGTANRNREMKESAEKGADKNDAKVKEKKADSKSSSDSSDSGSSSSSSSKPGSSKPSSSGSSSAPPKSD